MNLKLLDIDDKLTPLENYGWTNTVENHYNYTINEYRGKYHKLVLDYLFSKRYIKVIYDIGANSSATCDLFIYYSNKYKNKLNKIYLFEPDENNYKFIEKNIKKHPINLIQTFNKGIYYGKKKADVYLPIFDNKIYYSVGGFSISPDRINTIKWKKLIKHLNL